MFTSKHSLCTYEDRKEEIYFTNILYLSDPSYVFKKHLSFTDTDDLSTVYLNLVWLHHMV